MIYNTNDIIGLKVATWKKIILGFQNHVLVV